MGKWPFFKIVKQTDSLPFPRNSGKSWNDGVRHYRRLFGISAAGQGKDRAEVNGKVPQAYGTC